MIEQAELELRTIGEVEFIDRLMRLDKPKQGEGAIKEAMRVLCGDDRHAMSAAPLGPDGEPFRAQGLGLNELTNHGAISVNSGMLGHLHTEQARKAAAQLACRGGCNGTVRGHDDFRRIGGVSLTQM